MDGWFLSSPTDGVWIEKVPGEPWEFTGLEYDGVAWYRTQFTLPDWPDVYLGFGGVDDAAMLWVNGEKAGVWESIGIRPAFVDMLSFGKSGDQILIAIRVEDYGGYGGIKQPVRIGDSPQAVMTESQYVTWLADSHSSWPMPAWAKGGPTAWTMTGRPGAADETLLSSNGAIAPWATSPTAQAFIYDDAEMKLASGDPYETRFWLTNEHLPIPQWKWGAFGVDVHNILFADADRSAVHWNISLHNQSDKERELTVLVLVRPFAINQAVSPICTIATEDAERLWINGDLFMFSETSVSQTGVGLLEEAMAAALDGTVPPKTMITSAPAGNGAAVFAYRLQLEPDGDEAILLSFPDELGEGLSDSLSDHDNLIAAAVAEWDQSIGVVGLDLPDNLVEQGAMASMGYLLLSLDPDGPHPGPLAHDALWVRDAAYAGLALLQFGHAGAVRSTIDTILAAQEINGRIPPILGDKAPWDDEEWDSQGQAIFLATSYHRYTGELDTLLAWYPALRASAGFISDLRDSTSSSDGPIQGLLPPSKSAEDLGSAEWHHYWDDFWALAGLQEAAYAASLVGELEDEALLRAEADELRAAILNSIEAVMGPNADYIPSSVENLVGSAMARGTVPALWPVEVLPREMPLLSRSFQHYHKQFIAPDQGGFRHVQGQFWPYGGLELAHAYLRLGRLDVLHQILGWTLDHQTLPGTFAWAEQVHPTHGGFSGGDMPHAWAAADYATLVREMLISERGGALELFSGVPDWWLSDGKVISLENAPSHFGTLSRLETSSTVKQSEDAWNGDLDIFLTGASPKDGFRWRLPHEPTKIDGPPGTIIDKGWLIIPSSGGTVHLTFNPAQ